MRWSLLPLDQFARLEPAWRALCQRLGDPLPLDHTLIATLIETYCPTGCVIGQLERDGQTVGLGILRQHSRLVWETWQPDNAPLGPWLLDPSIDLEDALAGLLRRLPGLPLLLSLTQLDPAVQPRPANGGRTGTLDYIETPSLSLPGAFAPWFAGLSKNFRHNLDRQARLLDRLGIAVEIECWTAAETMATAVTDYARLEQSGWKGEAQSAVREDSGQQRFYTALLTSFAARGEAAVWRIRYDDVLAASDLCVHRGGTTVILKTAYNEALERHNTSPAQILRRRLFESLCKLGPHTVEFFGPAMPWHAAWTRTTRRIYHLNHYRWPLVARLHARAQRRAATP